MEQETKQFCHIRLKPETMRALVARAEATDHKVGAMARILIEKGLAAAQSITDAPQNGHGKKRSKGTAMVEYALVMAVVAAPLIALVGWLTYMAAQP